MNYFPNTKNNQDLILLDLFSGTGGFHKGLSEAGFNFKTVYFSEIEKHPIANYKYNYPNAKHIGSVEHILNAGIERPNIITFGSPCQDFSLAGNRAGLTGNRSSLIQYAITAISHFRPDIFIWENVKGTFSSNAGRDFWAIAQAFANIRGYDIEWQLVNTSWLLPQNRERIYLIGHLAESFGNWRGIFPITENDVLAGKLHETDRVQCQTTISTTVSTRCGQRPEDTFIELVNSGQTQKKITQINPSTESNNGKQPYQQNRIYDTNSLSPAISADPRSPIIPQNPDTNENPVIVASRGREESILALRRTEYGKAIRKEYEKGSIQEKRKNIQQLEPRKDGVSNTLTSVQKDNLLLTNSRIRRLTEIECERLQGFPDNWTKYGNYDGIIKPVPKTHRYKLIGNAVTSKIITLIGKRLLINFKSMDE